MATDSAQQHERWMERAIGLASEAWVAPNPQVGAVIVENGECIGEGYHAVYGAEHAERNAITDAHRRTGRQTFPRATMYCTLEPCSFRDASKHQPPCTEAILQAGIRRLVIAHSDPNPKVAGRGIAYLRSKGVSVDIGTKRRSAQALNRGYITRTLAGRPLVRLKLAQSIDGRIATAQGNSQWITSLSARRAAHRIRSESHAIMVGAHTLRRDNPQLTVRHVVAGGDVGGRFADLGADGRSLGSADLGAADVQADGRWANGRRAIALSTERPLGQGAAQANWRERNPQIVLASARLNIPADARAVKEGTIIFYSADGAGAVENAGLGSASASGGAGAGAAEATGANLHAKRAELEDKGARLIPITSMSVEEMMQELGRLKVNSLLVEGGAGLVTSFLKAGCFDELIVYIAPRIIGRGIAGVGDLGTTQVADSIRLVQTTWEQIDVEAESDGGESAGATGFGAADSSAGTADIGESNASKGESQENAKRAGGGNIGTSEMVFSGWNPEAVCLQEL